MADQLFSKKLAAFKHPLEELADEYAANDDGDLELRDVQAFLMEAIKLI